MAENQLPQAEPKKQKKEEIELKFEGLRKSFSQEVYIGVSMLEDIKTLIKAKVHFLSLRQKLLEENHTLIDNFNKISKQYRDFKSQEIIAVTSNLQLRLNEREKDKYLDGTPNLSRLKSILDMIDNQSKFYSETIKTVDQVLFSLKVRMDVEKMLNGD